MMQHEMEVANKDEPEVNIIGHSLSLVLEQMTLQRNNVELQNHLDKTNELLKLKSDRYNVEEAEIRSKNNFYKTNVSLLHIECFKHRMPGMKAKISS